jgi:hypothetical protein
MLFGAEDACAEAIVVLIMVAITFRMVSVVWRIMLSG